MTFDANEQMTETGLVSAILTITGAGQTWRLTNSDTPLDFLGQVYDPVPIQVSNIGNDVAMGGAEIEVQMPRSVSIAGRFFPVATKQVFRIVIRQVWHENGVVQDAPIAFTGVIMTASSAGEMGELIKLKCSTQMYKLDRNGLRRRYQHQCPHLVYGPDCRASETASALDAFLFRSITNSVAIRFPVQDPSRPRILRGYNVLNDEERVWLSGMSIELEGRRFEIMNVAISGLSTPGFIQLLVVPFPEDADEFLNLIGPPNGPAKAVRAIPNCDHTLMACRRVHDNEINYGGQPWIPFKNPVGTHFIG